MSNSDTLIVMADSRSPICGSLLGAPYFPLAAAINLAYCRRHGYDFLCYQFGDPEPEASCHPGWRDRVAWSADRSIMSLLNALASDGSATQHWQHAVLRRYARLRRWWLQQPDADPWRTVAKAGYWCEHPTLGARSAPWCKLVALRDALTLGYRTTVYIDSDAIFATPTRNIEAFLASATSTAAPVATADLIVLFSTPFWKAEANSGFMVWRNTAAARQLLDRWWDTDAGEFHGRHDYEQHTLNHVLLEDPACRERIAIVPELSFLEHRGQLVRHVASPHGFARVPRFRLGALRAGLDEDAFAVLMGDLGAHHVKRLERGDVVAASRLAQR
jgi:hypothetical protein